MLPEGRLFELMIVGVVALMVVGPKDLPLLLRKVGQALGTVRRVAGEFHSALDELGRQSELEELRRDVEALRASRPIEKSIDYGEGAKGPVAQNGASLALAAQPSEGPAIATLLTVPEAVGTQLR